MSRSTKQVPEQARQIQSELFTLTYGVLVAQLLEDIEDTSLINTKLDKIGYNIGVRLVDDIFSRNLNLRGNFPGFFCRGAGSFFGGMTNIGDPAVDHRDPGKFSLFHNAAKTSPTPPRPSSTTASNRTST